MTKIILIRHGQTSWNIEGKYQGNSDTELTDTGIDQAKKTATYLFSEKISAVYSSPLHRANQTARYIAYDRGLSVMKLSALREISFGDWEGLTYEAIKGKWPEELKQLFASPDTVKIPNGEMVAAVADRTIDTVMQLIDKHPNDTIVVVSHGMALRCIIAYFMHIPLRYVWNIRQDNASISMMTFYGREHAIIESLNETSHLH